ncbi:hypothetical protein Q1695_016365 [Nippostrongylus brasiliensis]|nr:hypothetical protein Q1695_016365 [Nippostrongylus brasiliensis]
MALNSENKMEVEDLQLGTCVRKLQEAARKGAADEEGGLFDWTDVCTSLEEAFRNANDVGSYSRGSRYIKHLSSSAAEEPDKGENMISVD